MRSLREALANAVPVIPALPDHRPACRHCNDYGTVLVREPYIVRGVNWGEVEVERPCPACSPVCPTCDGKGVVRYDVPPDDPRHAELFGKLHACRDCEAGQRVAMQMQLAALRKFELPAQYKLMTFETWDALPDSLRLGKWLARAAAGLFVAAGANGFYLRWEAICRTATRPCQEPDVERNSLVFQGPVGVGKTGLAAAILNALIESELNIRYARAADLIAEVQGRYGKPADEYPTATDVVKGYQTADLLVIDELNVALPVQPDKQRIIEDVIRYRHNNALPTVVTLNIGRDEFEAQWGLRTATALFAMAHWIPMSGAPLRNEGYDVEAF